MASSNPNQGNDSDKGSPFKDGNRWRQRALAVHAMGSMDTQSVEPEKEKNPVINNLVNAKLTCDDAELITNTLKEYRSKLPESLLEDWDRRPTSCPACGKGGHPVENCHVIIREITRNDRESGDRLKLRLENLLREISDNKEKAKEKANRKRPISSPGAQPSFKKPDTRVYEGPDKANSFKRNKREGLEFADPTEDEWVILNGSGIDPSPDEYKVLDEAMTDFIVGLYESNPEIEEVPVMETIKRGKGKTTVSFRDEASRELMMGLISKAGLKAKSTKNRGQIYISRLWGKTATLSEVIINRAVQQQGKAMGLKGDTALYNLFRIPNQDPAKTNIKIILDDEDVEVFEKAGRGMLMFACGRIIFRKLNPFNGEGNGADADPKIPSKVEGKVETPGTNDPENDKDSDNESQRSLGISAMSIKNKTKNNDETSDEDTDTDTVIDA